MTSDLRALPRVTKILLGVSGLLLLLWPLGNIFHGLRDADASPEERAWASMRANQVALCVFQTASSLALVAIAYLMWRDIRSGEDSGLTTQFTQAMEMLSSDRLEVRLGGIYTLEKIAGTSTETHAVIMEILTAFVRARASIDKRKSLAPPEMDIQSALTVVARRNPDHDTQPLNLSRCNLQGTQLDAAYFQGMLLDAANFEGAQLNGADFRGAQLTGANLQKAQLSGANFQAAQLSAANLKWAVLNGANLHQAKLDNANLQQASLDQANLHSASLNQVNLQGASLNAANLQAALLNEANLHQAQLNGALLKQAQLNDTILQQTQMCDVNFQQAELRNANLQWAQLRHADLRQVDLQTTNLDGANLEGALKDNPAE